ncbi:MAG TPA: iron-sulfur cluster assembly scaffold protein [Gemmatimonadaceae bacterium]|nr:iron-sulfur cluster assembly scaffold protein [Gemmatimonadaceae bacterium]
MTRQGLPYGDAITEHFRRPRNYGALPNATASAESVNALCGDRVRVAVLIDGGAIADARFTANACAICVAAASLLTEHVRGMSSSDAARLTDDDALALLESSVSAARKRCATLPLEALHRVFALIAGDAQRQPST